jgi:5-methylthioadenosine/S-adenosylhomocysteine deaminase
MGGAPEPVRYRADAVLPSDGTGRVFRPGEVEVAGDTITYVGAPRPPVDPAGATPAREVPLSGLLLPGFVNVHCHSPMILFRGTGENLPLLRWLEEVLWPREARLTPEDVFWGMTLATAELLPRGVTTTCEMYFFEDAVADAVVAAGSRAVITPAVIPLVPPGDDATGRPDWWAKRLDEVVDFHGRRHGEGGRLEVGLGPHAAYTVPLAVLADVAAAAQQLDAILHIHVAETEGEVARYAAETGRSVPEALADIGALDGRVIAAHSIWLSDADFALYRRHDVAVAHCPRSNAKLASGVAPLTRMLGEGIRVGLGTDGPASNNGLDMWEEMRFAALVARIHDRDAAAMPAPGALDLATRGGGAVLGRPDLGVLAPGSRADMVLVNLEDSVLGPLLHDAQLVEHVVWSGSSRLVTDVWVAGRQVVADGECLTVDVDEARRQVVARSRRLLVD